MMFRPYLDMSYLSTYAEQGLAFFPEGDWDLAELYRWYYLGGKLVEGMMSLS